MCSRDQSNYPPGSKCEALRLGVHLILLYFIRILVLGTEIIFLFGWWMVIHDPQSAQKKKQQKSRKEPYFSVGFHPKYHKRAKILIEKNHRIHFSASIFFDKIGNTIEIQWFKFIAKKKQPDLLPDFFVGKILVFFYFFIHEN